MFKTSIESISPLRHVGDGRAERAVAQNPGRTVSRVSIWKRALDVSCILFLLPLLLPIMLVIAAMIKFCSKGPVLFRQERIGLNGKRFLCLKFRTMHVNADTGVHQGYLTQLMTSNAPMTKMDNKGDSRLIRCGAILRSSGLDELPQLINVLRGEMSIVGPRPCLPYEYENYRPRYKTRFQALPGLTGFWQVNGKNKTTFRQMIAMDIWYAKNSSVGVDLWVMLKTFPTLLSQVREMAGRGQGNVVWFPTARRAAAILDAFLQKEARKSNRATRGAADDLKPSVNKSERKSLWQN